MSFSGFFSQFRLVDSEGATLRNIGRLVSASISLVTTFALVCRHWSAPAKLALNQYVYCRTFDDVRRFCNALMEEYVVADRVRTFEVSMGIAQTEEDRLSKPQCLPRTSGISFPGVAISSRSISPTCLPPWRPHFRSQYLASPTFEHSKSISSTLPSPPDREVSITLCSKSCHLDRSPYDGWGCWTP